MITFRSQPRAVPGKHSRTISGTTTRRVRPGDRSTRWLILALISVAGAAVQADPAATVIRHVNVIVGDGREPLPDRTVIIENGRITALRPGNDAAMPADAVVVDGRGGYLLPGFIDTHAHLAMGPVRAEVVDGTPVMTLTPLEAVAEATAASLLAYGVTTARDPGGPASLTVATRDRIADGTLPGPALQVAGEVIDTSRFDNLATTVRTAADVQSEVARQAAQGVDWIKLYVGLMPDLVEAGIDAAHQRGLRVTGHLHATTWTRAAELGIDSIVHALPGAPALLPEQVRDEYQASMRSLLYMLRWFALADTDSPALQAMAKTLRDHDVQVDPTLIVFHSMAHADRDEYRNNPTLSLVPPALVTNWRSGFNFNAGWSADDFEEARRLYPATAEFVRWLHEEGVVLSAGTDANNPWIVPGDSYHTELELLHDAGIPALDVLTIATRNGAATLGLLDEIGTVEAGKRADLVLLRGNPLDDIRMTREIAWVMKGGEMYQPERILAAAGNL